MKRLLLTFFVFIIPVSASYAATKSGEVKEANQLYIKGEYVEALNKYKDILKKDSETDVVNFNAGTVYYKTEDYENAVTHFRKGLLGKDETLKANAYYNLGNSLYKLGLSKEEQDLQSAVALLENSLGEYEKSLKINKEDKTVQSNHAFVKKELERLRKKLQQQQQDKTCPLPPKDNQDNEKQNQNKNKDQQNQNSEQEKSNMNKPEEQKEDQKQDQKQDEEKKQEESQPVEQNNEQQEQQQNQGQGGMAEQQNNVDQSEENLEEMSEQEYQMFLKEYQQNEEPKGLLNMQPRSMQIRETDKDW
ncbi:MAG TPA: tetratricopeptide repeat protein [Bacteroidetes bacterium]|nr:tetratricopeptide repeat protein [Bacteroidota bacterium]